MKPTFGRFIPQHTDKCYCQFKCQCGIKILNETIKSKHKFIKTSNPTVRFKEGEIKKFDPETSNSFIDPLDSKLINVSHLRFQTHNFNDRAYETEPNNLNFTERRKYYESEEKTYDKLTNGTKSNTELIEPIYSYDDQILKDIGKFRLQNIDECVNILNKYSYKTMSEKCDNNKNENEHICVHRYAVNERLFPVPILKDDKGQSICTECKKVSKVLIEENNKSNKTNEIETESNNNVPTIILEIQVDEKDKCNLDKILEIKPKLSNNSIKKRLVSETNLKMFKDHQMPANSLALRYQKRYP